ncbi:hypothetical protein LFT44_04725 [Arthrobacter sp. FW306-05-C]|uniref:hypothetical protein n=1 Tax=unclassified Arthrobacter TaxID=235627 RepID=UPI001EEFC741|nr:MULTISPECIES: hypothetical protein [unclassified Arthrobacter]UKA67725.1 hypothetical protein LFT44_04725 [Arthrobacter sp. FW306-05-C]UKA72203.1 hypothetical protein LFT49_05595 [Arthrobacter sp. FW306-06-A]UKA76431.1 hypothetical protein LFT46_05070 [Arthrobacter sp. FW306-07-I]
MATAIKPHTGIGRWAVLFGGLLLVELLAATAIGMAYEPGRGIADFVLPYGHAWGATAAVAMVLGLIGLLHYAERSVTNIVAMILGFLVLAMILLPPTYY